MKFLTLTAIDLRSERDAEAFANPAQAPEPHTQELDDLEIPVAPALPTSTPADAPEVKTFVTKIALASIREYHGRKHNRAGTRIVYNTGSAQIVKETMEEVENQINSLNN